MREVTLTIKNKVGLHARPAALFVRTAQRFKSEVLATKDDREANAKSILSVLALGAGQGSVVTLRVEGEDEVKAVKALTELVESGFCEEE